MHSKRSALMIDGADCTFFFPTINQQHSQPSESLNINFFLSVSPSFQLSPFLSSKFPPPPLTLSLSRCPPLLCFFDLNPFSHSFSPCFLPPCLLPHSFLFLSFQNTSCFLILSVLFLVCVCVCTYKSVWELSCASFFLFFRCVSMSVCGNRDVSLFVRC